MSGGYNKPLLPNWASSLYSSLCCHPPIKLSMLYTLHKNVHILFLDYQILTQILLIRYLENHRCYKKSYIKDINLETFLISDIDILLLSPQGPESISIPFHQICRELDSGQEAPVIICQGVFYPPGGDERISRNYLNNYFISSVQRYLIISN